MCTPQNYAPAGSSASAPQPFTQTVSTVNQAYKHLSDKPQIDFLNKVAQDPLMRDDLFAVLNAARNIYEGTAPTPLISGFLCEWLLRCRDSQLIEARLEIRNLLAFLSRIDELRMEFYCLKGSSDCVSVLDTITLLKEEGGSDE